MQGRQKQETQTWSGWFWQKLGYASEENKEAVSAMDAKNDKDVVSEPAEQQREVNENIAKGLEMLKPVPATASNKTTATQDNQAPQVFVEVAQASKEARKQTSYRLKNERAQQTLFNNKAATNNKNAHRKPEHHIDQPRGRGPR